MKKATVPAVAATFLVCAVFWLLITWSLDVQKLIAGAIICLVAALFSDHPLKMNPDLVGLVEDMVKVFDPLGDVALMLSDWVAGAPAPPLAL